MSHSFTRNLLHWYHHHNERSLPWKGENDPYKIWLSEIILQQTRAAQGLPYYLKFIELFPTVRHLATADEALVFKQWQGLGYYSRCRNLLKAAKIINEKYNSKFPDKYEDILSLPGVGPYTAAAIASFAFRAPYPVVDGNVFRVLSRYFGVEVPIDIKEGRTIIHNLAQELLDKKNVKDYNQAIMDFGATVCTPFPNCDKCALSSNCIAFKTKSQHVFPVKSKKIQVRTRHFHYFIIIDEEDRMYMMQRNKKDIWQGLYQPFLIESEDNLFPKKEFKKIIDNQKSIKLHDTLTQRLTHQLIYTHWYIIKIKNNQIRLFSEGAFYDKQSLASLALPKSVSNYLEKNGYF